MENNTNVVLKDLLDSQDIYIDASGKDKTEIIKTHFLNLLKEQDNVTIDMVSMKSLSPSFAYEAFGKLFDEFGDSIKKRLVFINDKLKLQERILKAIERRALMKESEKKSHCGAP